LRNETRDHEKETKPRNVAWLEKQNSKSRVAATQSRTSNKHQPQQQKQNQRQKKMVNYRRTKIPGGTYFFTVNLRDRTQHYLTDHINLLRQSFKNCHKNHPFTIDAIVILPEHLHTIPKFHEDA